MHEKYGSLDEFSKEQKINFLNSRPDPIRGNLQKSCPTRVDPGMWTYYVRTLEFLPEENSQGLLSLMWETDISPIEVTVTRYMNRLVTLQEGMSYACIPGKGMSVRNCPGINVLHLLTL